MNENDILNAIAIALYETDEAILDEAIAGRIAMGDLSWKASSHPHIQFSEIAPELRRAYLRRARAARAAEAYLTASQRN